jgi:ATP-dependent Lon protease
LRLDPASLRWRCESSWLPFASTAEVEPIKGVIGQDDAVEAMRFGLDARGLGRNVFIRGLVGTGRMTLAEQLVAEMRPECPPARDRLYVHNFDEPDRPRLLSLPAGRGREFARRVEALIDYIRKDLQPVLSSDRMRAARRKLDEMAQKRMRSLGDPLDKELRKESLALVPVQVGQTLQPSVLPLVDGQPVPLEKIQQLRDQGEISDEKADDILQKVETFQRRFDEVHEKIQEIQTEHRTAVQALFQREARAALRREITNVERDFPEEAVREFLRRVVEDLVSNHLGSLDEDSDFTRRYRVNVIVERTPDDCCPIVIENAPTLPNLLGHVDRQMLPGGVLHSDHTMIRAGSLLRAEGGFLIIEAREVLTEPGAWRALVRTLRTGKLEIVPSELSALWSFQSLTPEPIEIDVKVILLGDPNLYYMLDALDPDFPHLFKVLADFDSTIPRTTEGAGHYSGWLARLVQTEGLRPFSSAAVAKLVEHGARIAAQRGRLTSRFGRLADIARESSYLARRREAKLVDATDVLGAIRSSKRRADLPARRFRRLLADGTIRIQVRGGAVGQVNGLAVMHAGPLTYGFPTRITATIGAGTAGAINIERESQLSGAIHTKGFYILGGLLRHLLRVDHPLAFSASVAFEQSYGGIDGDSASGAEICCLLSALTEIPLAQGLAMTGAIDQLGQILPVGAVTEKVEGFFDCCQELGLADGQGVIVPRANEADLMLREDVVEACEAGRFRVYAVGRIEEALELLTGIPAGERGPDGHYSEETVLGHAEASARRYWEMVSPASLLPALPEGEEGDEVPDDGE